jgi:hypothetical protein
LGDTERINPDEPVPKELSYVNGVLKSLRQACNFDSTLKLRKRLSGQFEKISLTPDMAEAEVIERS